MFFDSSPPPKPQFHDTWHFCAELDIPRKRHFFGNWYPLPHSTSLGGSVSHQIDFGPWTLLPFNFIYIVVTDCKWPPPCTKEWGPIYDFSFQIWIFMQCLEFIFWCLNPTWPQPPWIGGWRQDFIWCRSGHFSYFLAEDILSGNWLSTPSHPKEITGSLHYLSVQIWIFHAIPSTIIVLMLDSSSPSLQNPHGVEGLRHKHFCRFWTFHLFPSKTH